MRHSDFQPTGRFAAAGDVITVDVPEGAPAVGLVIGLYGSHSGLNGGNAPGHRTWSTPVGSTSVTSDRDGMIYLVSTAPRGEAHVRVSGGRSVPTFVRGATSNADWADEVERFGDAPLFEIVGDRVLGDFQQRTLPYVPEDLAARVAEFDRVIDVTDSVYGLSRTATADASRKSPHRIAIASPDSGGGYASATQERVTFQVNTGAAADLFRAPRWDQWGFWHEVGHTYQTPSYNWAGLGEVLVNVSPLSIQGQTWGVDRLDDQVGQYDAFFARPIADRRFDDAGTWGKLFMFDQLRRAFGESFYPRLNQEMRVDALLGALATPDDQAKRQAFARYASTVADRDLRPFFAQWGIGLSEATAADLAQRPALTAPIWESRLASDMPREHEITQAVLPTGTLAAVREQVVVGQQRLRGTPEVSGLQSSDGAEDARVDRVVLAARDIGTGSVRVGLVNDRGGRDILSGDVQVTAPEGFRFRGLSDRSIGILALDPIEHRLRFIAHTTYTAHPNFGAREYLGFELRTADDRTSIGSWSVAGNQTGYALQAALDQHYDDGQVLVVRHLEPKNRLEWFHDGQTERGMTATEQRFRIVGDRIVRAEQPVVAVPGDPAVLSRGSAVPVGVRVHLTQDTTSMTGTLHLFAPEGTAFADGQTELQGWYRLPGGAWTASPELTGRYGAANSDRSELRFSLDTAGVPTLAAGTEVEWRPSVAVPADAVPGSAGLRFEVSGTAEGTAFRAAS